MDRTETTVQPTYRGKPIGNPITVITEDDGGGVLYVLTDYNDGREPVLSMSTPSGRQAGYQEARDRLLIEARAKVAAKRDAIVAHFGGRS